MVEQLSLVTEKYLPILYVLFIDQFEHLFTGGYCYILIPISSKQMLVRRNRYRNYTKCKYSVNDNGVRNNEFLGCHDIERQRYRMR